MIIEIASTFSFGLDLGTSVDWFRLCSSSCGVGTGVDLSFSLLIFQVGFGLINQDTKNAYSKNIRSGNRKEEQKFLFSFTQRFYNLSEEKYSDENNQ
mgnify:CR=1 FL=1